MHRSFFLVLMVLLLIAGGLPSATQDEPANQDEPLDLGLTERADISLMFIDVIAVDAAGRPMPGLKKEDFRLKLDYVPREIYSVDDLCPCSAQGEPLAAAPVESELTADLAPIREQKPPLFVLYFDFSQLQQNGRAQALQEGRRWIEQAMQPDDRAMLVGYTGKAGVTADGFHQ